LIRHRISIMSTLSLRSSTNYFLWMNLST